MEKHWGVYATRTIQKGDVITYYGGKYFETEGKPPTSHHLFQLRKAGCYIDGVYTAEFSIAVMVLTDQVGSLCNTSWGDDGNPNNATIIQSNSQFRVKIVASRKILAGTEILVSYGVKFRKPGSITPPSTPPPTTPPTTPTIPYRVLGKRVRDMYRQEQY